MKTGQVQYIEFSEGKEMRLTRGETRLRLGSGLKTLLARTPGPKRTYGRVSVGLDPEGRLPSLSYQAVTERNYAATFTHLFAPSWRGRMRSLQLMRDNDKGLPANDELVRLLAEIKDGSERSLQCLNDACWAPLVRAARKLGHEEDKAEEIVSAVLSSVWENRRHWRPTGSARAYLYRIVRNKAIDVTRKSRTWQRLIDQWGWWMARKLHPKPSTPAQDLDAEELWDRIKAAIAALPARQREVFTLYVLEGLSYAEIAEVMNISKQTVANQMSAALRSVRLAIERN